MRWGGEMAGITWTRERLQHQARQGTAPFASEHEM
jgi:hypothetical protein